MQRATLQLSFDCMDGLQTKLDNLYALKANQKELGPLCFKPTLLTSWRDIGSYNHHIDCVSFSAQ
jgi:hypothetical protein